MKDERCNMSVNKNEKIVLDSFEAFNRQDFDAIMELVTDNFTYFSVTRYSLNREEYRKFLDDTSAPFTDFKITVERTVSQGNVVVAETILTGTHKGEYLGIPATGKSIELPAVYIFDFEAGKIKLIKYYANLQSLLQQLSE